jgi:hypothetical protein
MKTKLMFYGLLGAIVFGSFSFSKMEDSKTSDVLTAAPTFDASDELRPPAELREERYELMEAQAEVNTP